MSLLIDKISGIVSVVPGGRMVSVCSIALAPDKSVTHRAFFFAGMAQGRSSIRNASTGADCNATLEAMRSLGVSVERLGAGEEQVCVFESGGLGSWSSPKYPIDAQNSGTTARLLIGIAAARAGLEVTLVGDESLSKRPMDRIAGPLTAIGADIAGEGRAVLLPVCIRGKRLQGFTLETQVPSAQVKSALLFAAVSASGQSEITVPSGTRDHTERMLGALGAPLLTEFVEGGKKIKFLVTGPWQPSGFNADIPGDPSSLAFFAALAFIHPGLEIRVSRVLGNAGRMKYLSCFERMGLTVSIAPNQGPSCLGEEVVDVALVRRGAALPLDLGPEEIPALIDEIPALAVALSSCPGKSQIKGLAELRIKESDRLAEIEHLLKSAGCSVQASGDLLIIDGGQPVRGFDYHSEDHRMVMAATILATTANKICNIGSYQAPAVSFPLFFDMVRQLYA